MKRRVLAALCLLVAGGTFKLVLTRIGVFVQHLAEEQPLLVVSEGFFLLCGALIIWINVRQAQHLLSK
jgi:hypothetical protein